MCGSCINTCAVPRLCQKDLGTVAEQRDRGGPANPVSGLGGERYLRRKHLWGCASSSFQLGGSGGTAGVGGGWRDEEEEGERERGGEREKMRCCER